MCLLNKEQKELRINLMRVLAKNITAIKDKSYILNGGTGLLLCYDLNRFSEDMDFDGVNNKFDLGKVISKSVDSINLTVESLILKKDTPTTKRYMLHYGGKMGSCDYPLKIEISFRQGYQISKYIIKNVNGITTYDIDRYVDMKLAALFNRNKCRDTFDVNFLLKNYLDYFSVINLNRLKNFISERVLEQLVFEYEEMKQTDLILKDTDGLQLWLEIHDIVDSRITPANDLFNCSQSFSDRGL